MKIELDRVFSNGYEAITFKEENYLVCQIEENGKVISRVDLRPPFIFTEHLYGSASLCFDSSNRTNNRINNRIGMTYEEPPSSFKNEIFAMISVSSKYKNLDEGEQEFYSKISFICTNFFNSAFQAVFLCDKTIDEAILLSIEKNRNKVDV